MVCLSQPLAIVPYLFRSLRLRKMYEARQIYWLDNKMPKKMIKNWNEKRLAFYLLFLMLLFSTLYLVLSYYSDNFKLPCYNTLSFLVYDVSNWEFQLKFNQCVIYSFNLI
jgi:hypothetical protein